jgi:chemotaxis signal transduction protein
MMPETDYSGTAGTGYSAKAGNGHSEKARRMREEFDGSFALPARDGATESADLLAIGVHGDGFALRVLDIAGIAAGKKILPLPGAPAALLGLSGIRGALVPVWDLATLLGYGVGGVTRREPRWLVLGPGEAPWALAFEEFEGYFRVPRSDLLRVAEGVSAEPAASGFAQETCSVGGAMRKVIGMGKLLEAAKAIVLSSRITRIGKG